jgi:hypothetical protein
MRSNHTLTITVNTPDEVGCTAVTGNEVLSQAVTVLSGEANRLNRTWGSDVRVDRASATVETTQDATPGAANAGGLFEPLNVDDLDTDAAEVAEAVNAIGAQMNAVTETLARLTALAERAERYIGR